MLRYLTAGESHGMALTVIIDGLPAGLRIDTDFINGQLKRRRSGLGRGPRMKIEKDEARIVSGTKKGVTIGSPVAVYIENKDAKIEELPPVICPRPGHADLAGMLKYGADDIRSVLERASARETAARTAAGAVARIFLREFSIETASHVVEVAGIRADTRKVKIPDIFIKADKSPLRCLSRRAEKKMISAIKAVSGTDTVGGVFEVVVIGLPPGLGTYTQWDRRMDAGIARAVMSIPGVKGVEIGLGFRMEGMKGSQVHDPIYFSPQAGYYRRSNNCGGIEGGISNGEPVVVRGVMKPISTLKRPLPSVDIFTKKPHKASVERSDVCAVPSAGVVAEAVVSWEAARAFLEKFSGDCMRDIRISYKNYMKRIKE